MNWNDFVQSLFHTNPGMLDILLRLACAMGAGLIIGVEREFTHRPAGMRTHILVALGACVVSITGELLFHQYSGLGSTADPARLSAQVITGVGFLGAGTIMREGASVKGLTTAASLWAVACLGIASGFGYYSLTIAGTVFILVTLSVFERLQGKFQGFHIIREKYELETTDISNTLSVINQRIQEHRGSISRIDVEPAKNGHRLRFQAEFGGRHQAQHREKFFTCLSVCPEVTSLHHSDAHHSRGRK